MKHGPLGNAVLNLPDRHLVFHGAVWWSTNCFQTLCTTHDVKVSGTAGAALLRDINISPEPKNIMRQVIPLAVEKAMIPRNGFYEQSFWASDLRTLRVEFCIEQLSEDYFANMCTGHYTALHNAVQLFAQLTTSSTVWNHKFSIAGKTAAAESTLSDFNKVIAPPYSIYAQAVSVPSQTEQNEIDEYQSARAARRLSAATPGSSATTPQPASAVRHLRTKNPAAASVAAGIKEAPLLFMFEHVKLPTRDGDGEHDGKHELMLTGFVPGVSLHSCAGATTDDGRPAVLFKWKYTPPLPARMVHHLLASGARYTTETASMMTAPRPDFARFLPVSTVNAVSRAWDETHTLVPISAAIAGFDFTALEWQSQRDLSGTYVFSRVLQFSKPAPAPVPKRSAEEEMMDAFAIQEDVYGIAQSWSAMTPYLSSSSSSSFSSSDTSPHIPMASLLTPARQLPVRGAVPARAQRDDAEPAHAQRDGAEPAHAQRDGAEPAHAQRDGAEPAHAQRDGADQGGGHEQSGGQQSGAERQLSADDEINLILSRTETKITRLSPASRVTIATMTGSVSLSSSSSSSSDSQSLQLQQALQRKKDEEQAEKDAKVRQAQVEKDAKVRQAQVDKDAKAEEVRVEKERLKQQREAEREARQAAKAAKLPVKRKPGNVRSGRGKKAKPDAEATAAGEQSKDAYEYTAVRVIEVKPDDVESPSFKISITRLPELTAGNREEISERGAKAAAGESCSACLLVCNHNGARAVKCSNSWDGDDGEPVHCGRYFNRGCFRAANVDSDDWKRFFDKNAVPLSSCPLCETCVGCWQAFDGAESRQCDLCRVFFCDRCHDVDGLETEFYCRACTPAGAPPAAAAASSSSE